MTATVTKLKQQREEEEKQQSVRSYKAWHTPGDGNCNRIETTTRRETTHCEKLQGIAHTPGGGSCIKIKTTTRRGRETTQCEKLQGIAHTR